MNVAGDRIAYAKKMADLTRYDLVAMLSFCGSGHPGGSLSIVEIVSALYHGKVISYDPKNPNMPGRDRLVVSKGHASPTLYVTLAELGYFPKEWLREFDANGSRLPKHCDRLKTPGIEASTGALGQGISMAVGMALAQKLGKEDYGIYCIIGDGECQSGNTFEAAMSAGKYALGNLTVIIDANGLQIDGNVDDVMPLGNIRLMWEALGFRVWECDGHDIAELIETFEEMKRYRERPKLLIANTVKGKGVSFMEHKANWHSDKIGAEQAAAALSELAPLVDGALTKAGFLSKDELSRLAAM